MMVPPSGRPHIWLLSAYRSDSHAAWADWLTDTFTDIDWSRLELPGRHFGWRVRGNPLSWLDALPAQTPDAVLATSMVDLATLRGLHPRLVAIPAGYYFHENQFAYPASDRQVTSLEARMVQLYGALAADRLLFNSGYNRDSFFAGVTDLLGRMPDAVPAGVAERLAAKAGILPVPIRPVPPVGHRDERLILWNHRWEYDKAPELFCRAMLGLAGQGADFRLALLGARPEPAPEPLARLRRELPERIAADGHLEKPAYRDLLGRAGIVVSTAIHEFQGLAMLEAAGAGARPLAPDALCYPEQYPPACRYPAGDVDALVRRLAVWLTDGLPPMVTVADWTPANLHGQWSDCLYGLGRYPRSESR